MKKVKESKKNKGIEVFWPSTTYTIFQIDPSGTLGVPFLDGIYGQYIFNKYGYATRGEADAAMIHYHNSVKKHCNITPYVILPTISMRSEIMFKE
jgi:hypothetical protein